MQDLFKYVAKVTNTDSFSDTVEKITNGLKTRTNSVVQRNLLLANFPQGTKSFDRWSAKLIDYADYDWKQASSSGRDAVANYESKIERKGTTRQCLI